MRISWAILLTATLLNPVRAAAIELELPLACEFGKTCWIQQYVDHDASPSAKDYTCGGETYDGHDGTDFRVLNTRADVSVVAAAPGLVKAKRDGVEDRLATTPELLAAVSKTECGNGVVIAHQGGFETQYCHLRRGSVAVKAGDMVAAGTVLGKVGYSGAAAFPHLHLSVRRRGQKLDPFDGANAHDCSVNAQSMWSATAAQALAYEAGSVIETGWAQGKISGAELDVGEPAAQTPTAQWPAVVAYVRAINLQLGDELSLKLAGPNGALSESQQTLDHDKAQFMIFAGVKVKPTGWPAGAYKAEFVVMRQGTNVLQRSWTADIK